MDEVHDSDETMGSETEENSSSSSSSSVSSAGSDEEFAAGKITLKARKDRRSRGKWKLLSNKKKFKKEWLILFPWVEKDPKNPQLASCKLCTISMKALKTTLETHQKSKKHMKKIERADFQSTTISEPNGDDKPIDPRPANVQPPLMSQPQPQQYIPPPPLPPQGAGIGIDQITDEQISFFAESQADAAHQAVTSIIDKLVEKYHENRLLNLKIQNDAMYELNAERAKIVRTVNQRKLERRLQQEAYIKQAEEAHLRSLITEHETKLHAMERERDAKLRAVEQELVFAKQEYEKKVRLLDSQLSSMK